MKADEIIYIGHRGYGGRYPENTRIAFQKAVDNGFKGVEFDVHITKDNEAVIMHDESPKRTTLDAETRQIADMTLAELRELDIKGNFDVPKQTIMTLKEFCEEFNDKFELIVMELKTDERNYKGIEKMSWEITKPYVEKEEAKWIMSSFNMQTCLNFIKLNTSMDVALLYVFLFMIKDIDVSKFDSLHPEASLLLRSEKDVQVKKGVKFNVWTVNDKKLYNQVIKFHKKNNSINGIITNFKIWKGEFGPEQILNAEHQELYQKGLKKENEYLENKK